MVLLAVCIALVVVLPVLAVGCLVARSKPARPTPPPLPPTAPQWAPDPTRRHEFRFWNGTHWTADVADRGVVTLDPV
jgi:hypothetical protein